MTHRTAQAVKPSADSAQEPVEGNGRTPYVFRYSDALMTHIVQQLRDQDPEVTPSTTPTEHSFVTMVIELAPGRYPTNTELVLIGMELKRRVPRLRIETIALRKIPQPDESELHLVEVACCTCDVVRLFDELDAFLNGRQLAGAAT